MEEPNYMNKESAGSSLQPAKAAQPVKTQQPGMSPMMTCQMAYPEVYYKLQPYVMMVCDQLECSGNAMPTQDMLDRISDGIYSDMQKRYPDMADYMRSQEERASTDQVIQTIRYGFDPDMHGWRFRRRGVFRDLIDILLLSELFGRRRRRY